MLAVCKTLEKSKGAALFCGSSCLDWFQAPGAIQQCSLCCKTRCVQSLALPINRKQINQEAAAQAGCSSAQDSNIKAAAA